MKTKIIQFSRAGVIGLLLLSSCYYDNEEDLYADISYCEVTDVDYQLTIKPIIDANCATSGCHVPGTGRKDLSTDQGIMSVVNDGRLEDRVLTRKDMPPSQPLSSCELSYIREWLDKGAPAN